MNHSLRVSGAVAIETAARRFYQLLLSSITRRVANANRRGQAKARIRLSSFVLLNVDDAARRALKALPAVAK